MSSPHQPVVVLSRALDQAGDALAAVHADDLDRPTPCHGWTVRELADHLAAAPEHFLQQARGEEVDWSAGTGIEPAKLASHFRVHADDLLHHWHDQADDQVAQADWGRTRGTACAPSAGRCRSTTRSPSVGWPSCSRG